MNFQNYWNNVDLLNHRNIEIGFQKFAQEYTKFARPYLKKGEDFVKVKYSMMMKGRRWKVPVNCDTLCGEVALVSETVVRLYKV